MPNIPRYEITAEEFELIESWLSQQLSGEELLQFEQRLQQDGVFKSKVEEVRYLIAGIREAHIESKLSAFHAAIDEKKKEIATPSIAPGAGVNYRWWWVAAAVLLFIAGTWFLWPRGSRDERLFATYFVPDGGLPVAMGSADAATYLFYDGMVSYKEANYAEALSKWHSLDNTVAANDTLHYYQAMAYLNLNDYPRAAAILSPLGAKNDFALQDDAIWYLALIQLKSNSRQEAVELLRRLKGREEAQQLLSELED